MVFLYYSIFKVSGSYGCFHMHIYDRFYLTIVKMDLHGNELFQCNEALFGLEGSLTRSNYSILDKIF